jgi:hypothetical protein
MSWWRPVEAYGFWILLVLIFVPGLREHVFTPYASWALVNTFSLLGL